MRYVPNVVALVVVLLPLASWLRDLSSGKLVEVAGPWWVFWLLAWSGVVSWTTLSIYHGQVVAKRSG